MEYRNAQFNANESINLEVNHPVLGWVPFTASPSDPNETGRDIYAQALASGDVAPFVPPPEPTPEERRAAMDPITPRQLRLTLLTIGITEAQVDAALVNDPAGQIEWKYATYFKRSHPLVEGLGAIFSITPVQIDSLWAYAQDL